MYKLTIVTAGGVLGTTELTGQEDKWQIADIRGLDPPKGDVNITQLAGIDGGRYNSFYINTRNIVITFKINGDPETNRLRLCAVFPQHKRITLKYENGTRAVQTRCYVESVSYNPFTFPMTMQVSLICPDPYFYDQTEQSNTGKNVTARNSSTSLYQGYNMQIVLVSSSGDATSVSVRAGNSSNIVMQINYNFVSGDVIDICTIDGQKSVTLTRGNAATNLFPYLEDGSEFYQLEPTTQEGVTKAETVYYYANTSQTKISNTSSISWTTRYLGV